MSDLIESFADPNELYEQLDSFWRAYTTPDTQSLLRYQSYAQLICWAWAVRKVRSILDSRISNEPYCSVPWYPVVIWRDRLSDQSFHQYGDPYIYDNPPQILYGDPGAPRFRHPVPTGVVGFTGMYDQVVRTQYKLGLSEVTVVGQYFEFYLDPFTIRPAKLTPDSNRQYQVWWVRDARIDLSIPFDAVGWVLGYGGQAGPNYAAGVQALWRLALEGPSVGRFVDGLLATTGQPAVRKVETVLGVFGDTVNQYVQTADNLYRVPGPNTAIATLNGQVTPAVSITSGVRWFDNSSIGTATTTELPGLACVVPLRTGAKLLSFANINTAWTFQAGRPSEWRFPIGGEPADVEQYWVEVADFATANGINVATLFGLPAAVNPLQMLATQLLGSMWVSTIDGPAVKPESLGFVDNARRFLSPASLVIVHQRVGTFLDQFDAGTQTGNTVTAGYHADGILDTMSVSGTDLIYQDDTPFVVSY